jgi:hypothetical protein
MAEIAFNLIPNVSRKIVVIKCNVRKSDKINNILGALWYCLFLFTVPHGPVWHFKMAGCLDFHNPLNISGKLKPPTASLQNCLKCSHDYRYFSLLCDFGIATIVQVEGKHIRFAYRFLLRKNEN